MKQKQMVSTILLILFSFAIVFSHSSFAQTQPPSLDVLKNQLPAGGPVSDFINSLQNTGADFNVRNTWLKVNSWFSDTTGGTNLTDVLKFAGNLLIWFFSLFINLIKLGLSLL